MGSLPDRNFLIGERKVRYASSSVDKMGVPDLQVWDVDHGEFLHMRYSDGVEFWLDRELATLWAHWPASSSLEDALSYLVGPILGLLLRLRGVVCLHGSAVSIHDKGVVFVGSEGAGKSTTAAAFAMHGHPVLSDDIVGLSEGGGEFQILPAYPRINLWPDSVNLLFGAPDALPVITAGWDKRCLKLGEVEGTKFEERPLPLGAIYIFGDSEPGSQESIELISQRAALMRLVGNTYATNFLDAEQRAEEFAVLSRLIAAVPVRQINTRQAAVRPNELCMMIQQDFARITSRTSAIDH